MWSHRIRGCLATLVVVCSCIRLSCSGTTTTQPTSTVSDEPVAATSVLSTTLQVRTTSQGPPCEYEGQFGCCKCGPGYTRKGKDCVADCGTGFYGKFKADNRPLHEVCPELFTTVSPTTVDINTTYTIQTPRFGTTGGSTSNGNNTSVGQTTTQQLSTQGPVEPISNYTCERCPLECSSCVSESECHVCDNDYLLFNGSRCITREQCASKGNFYSNGTHCSECNPTCVNCTSYTTDEKDCTCRYYVHEGKCKDNCPEGTRAERKKCIKALDIPLIAGVSAGGGALIIIIIVVVIICVCRHRKKTPEAPSPPSLEELNRAETNQKRVSDPRQRPVYENVSNPVASTTDIQRGHDAVTRYTRDPTLPFELEPIGTTGHPNTTSNSPTREEGPHYGNINNDGTIYQNVEGTDSRPLPRSAKMMPDHAVHADSTEPSASVEDGQVYANMEQSKADTLPQPRSGVYQPMDCHQGRADTRAESDLYTNMTAGSSHSLPAARTTVQQQNGLPPDQNLPPQDPNVYGNVDPGDQRPAPRSAQGGQDNMGYSAAPAEESPYGNLKYENGQLVSAVKSDEASSNPVNSTPKEVIQDMPPSENYEQLDQSSVGQPPRPKRPK